MVAVLCAEMVFAVFARYVNDRNRMDEQEFNVETLAGTKKNYGVGSLTFYCSVDMGVPDDSPEKIKAAQSYPIKTRK